MQGYSVLSDKLREKELLMCVQQKKYLKLSVLLFWEFISVVVFPNYNLSSRTFVAWCKITSVVMCVPFVNQT